MKLNRTGSNWDRLERNKINENWDRIEEGQNQISKTIDDLVLESGGDSNLEVVQARGGERVLNERLNKIEDNLGETAKKVYVDETMATKTELTNAVNPKADKNYVNSELSKKANDSEVRKNTVPIGINDVAPDLLEAITGGSTVDVLSIPRDDSVDEYKATFLRRSTNIFSSKNERVGFRIDPENGELIASEQHITSDFQRIKPNQPIITGEFALRYALYDISNNFIESNTLNNGINDGVINPTSESYFYRLTYSRTANLPRQVNEGTTLLPYEEHYVELDKNIRLLIPPVEDLGFFSGNPSALNFDFKNKKIIIENSAIIHRNTRYVLQPQTINLSGVTSQFNILYYDLKTGLVKFTRQGNVLDKDSIVFGSFDLNNQLVFNISYFYINGKPNWVVDDKETDVYEDDYYVVDVGDVYSSPEMENVGLGTPNDLSKKTMADVYALYDNLMNGHSSYISKLKIGEDSWGNSIYRYDFIPEAVESPTTKTPKILIITGTHGPERAALWVAYQGMKQLCEGWKTDELLEKLRWNVHFIVIPISNPSGWEDYTRKNRNGIDINRQFPTGWKSGNPDDSTYGGTAPLTEPEALAINNILENEEDLIYVCDFHNYSYQENRNYMIWNAFGTKFNANIAKTLIRKMSRKWKSEIDFLVDDDSTMYGFISATPGGSIARQASSIGIQSSTFEIGQEMFSEPNHERWTSLVIEMGVESFINWLALVLQNNIRITR